VVHPASGFTRGLMAELSNATDAAQPAAGNEAAASNGCGLAPLIRSRSMIATSPSWGGEGDVRNQILLLR
jgi:hypothetical protein